MGNCTKCELYKTSRVKSNNKIYECVCLPGEGPKTAKILMIGMCPGKTEIINKKPFVGDSGQMLNACLAEAGLSRKDLYITNLVKCRSLPIEKKPGYWEDREPNTKEIKACLPYLEEEIKEIKPNVIVLLGNLVSKTMIGKTNITQIHGNPFWSEQYQATCIPLYHPSFLVRKKDAEGLKNRKDFIEDLKFVKQSAESKEFKAKTKKKTQYIICDTLPKITKAIKRLNSVPEFAFDIETTGLSVDDDRPLCISFSWAEATAIVIPIWDWQRGELWSQEDLAYIKSQLKLVMENPNIKKIGHNISFDIFFLNKKWGWDIQGAYFDTMFGYYLLDPDRKGSQRLHDLAWIYTDMGGYDERVKADRENGFKNTAWDDLYEYSASDSDCTYRIYQAIKKELEPYMFVMTEIMVPLSIITTEMRYTGIQIDVEYLDKLTQEYAKRIEEQEKAINELPDIKAFSDKYLKEQRKEILAKYEKSKLLKKKYTQEEYLNKNIQAVNLGSTKQLRELLFSHLGLPVVKRTKQSKDASTDEASLELLKGEHEFIDMLLELRYLKKLHSTYLSPIREKLDKNNRLHTDYSLSRTATGRLASSNINLQNIPKKKDGKLIRDYFIASPGNVLLSSDLCVEENTKIATNRGLIPIKDICADDGVYSDDKKIYKVNAKIYKGKKECIKVVTKLGYELIATKDHRIRVLDSSGNYVWKHVSNLNKNDYISIQAGCGLFHAGKSQKLPKVLYTHFSNKKIKSPNRINTKLAEFLGYLTGDGSFGRHTLSWTTDYKDKDVQQRMCYLMKKLFGKATSTVVYRGAFDNRVSSIPLLNWLKTIGSSKKNVPEFLWKAKPTIVAAYLRGLFEADGSVCSDALTGGRVSFCSVNESLAKEVQQLLLSLGIIAIYRQQSAKQCLNGKSYSITIPASFVKKFKNKVNFISKRKKNKLIILNKTCNYKPTYGGIPNLQKKADDLKLKGFIRKLLNNTIASGRPISPNLIKRLVHYYPIIAGKLGLYHVAQYNHFFDKVVSINVCGEKHVYDLSVPKSFTYVGNGFINHNCQIEYRILAHYVNDAKQIQDIASGQDIHREVAASAYKIPMDKVTSEQRDGAKAITFGLPYGRSSISLAEEYGMSPEEAEEYIRAFFGKYPKVKLWIDMMIKVAKQKCYVKNFFGRKRYLPKINDPDNFIRGEEERKVVSTCIQGSASDILSLDTIRVAKRLKELKSKAKLVLTIHDDIVLDTPKEELEQIVELLRTEMQRPIDGIRVPLKTEIKIGERWGSLEKYEEKTNETSDKETNK